MCLKIYYERRSRRYYITKRQMRKMNDVKVSVVVPCLNVKDYISECLDSLVNQTLNDIEIICVDAFSTDGTREIISEYQKNDSRILLLDDDKRSSGYADNLGISKARGEYVGIVESDDYVHKDVFLRLYSEAIENAWDDVKGGLRRFAPIREERVYFFEKTSMKELKISDRVICPSEHPKLLIRDGYMWKGIYKRSFIENNRIKLNETKGAAYQDNGFLHQTICQAKRVMYIDDAFYYYRCDNDNSSFLNKKGLFMMLEEYRFVDAFMKSVLEKEKAFSEVYYKKMFSMLQAQAKKIDLCDQEGLRAVWDGYKEYFRRGISEKAIRQDEWGILFMELEWFLEDEWGYISYLKRRENYLKRRANELKEDLNGKDVVIVGAGYIGELTYALLLNCVGTSVLSFCDNDSMLYGQLHCGKSVISVQEAAEKYRNAHFVIAIANFKFDVFDQLQEYGISQGQIRVINFDMNPLIAIGK